MNTEKQDAVSSIGGKFGIELNHTDYAVCLELLAKKINTLVIEDFPGLINILYRMDISEMKLKDLLEKNPGEDEGMIIAKMMMEREEQKIRARRENKTGENISDEESW